MSIPLIRRIAMTQQAAATPSVAAWAAVRRAAVPAGVAYHSCLLGGDKLGGGRLRLQERGVLALECLGWPRVPGAG
jgi:hypothetical protein